MVESLVHAQTRVCGEGVVSLARQPLAGKKGLDWTGCAIVVVAAESNCCVTLTQPSQIIIEVGRQHPSPLQSGKQSLRAQEYQLEFSSPYAMSCSLGRIMIEESAEGHQTLFSSGETTLSLMHAAEIPFEVMEVTCSFISATMDDTTMTTDYFSTPLSKSNQNTAIFHSR